MRKKLKEMSEMFVELRLGPKDWIMILPVVTEALNESSMNGLGKIKYGIDRCPLEFITGIAPKRPILKTLSNENDHKNFKQIIHTRAQQVVDIEYIQAALNDMHLEVVRNLRTRREKAIETHIKAKNIIEPKFDVGDFVLVRRTQDPGHKMSFKWYGPRLIVETHGSLV